MADRRQPFVNGDAIDDGEHRTTPAPPTRALLDILDDVHDAALLRRLASHYEHLSRIARSRAALLEQRAATWRDSNPRAATATPLDAIAAYLSAGNTLDAAIRSVAAQTGLSADSLAQSYHARAAAKARQQRRERNAAILAMAGRGMRDKEIADALGGQITAKHVNKIVRRAIRAQSHKALAS